MSLQNAKVIISTLKLTIASNKERERKRETTEKWNLKIIREDLSLALKETSIGSEIVFHDRNSPIRDNASGRDYLEHMEVYQSILSNISIWCTQTTRHDKTNRLTN